jgi:hypothetical protein
MAGDGKNVVDIGERAGYRPDMAGLARSRVASARRNLGMSAEESPRFSARCSAGRRLPA